MALLDPYTDTWDIFDASHLLRRVGFGGNASEREALAQMTLADAVASLVDIQPTDPFLDGPSAGNGPVHGAPLVDLPSALADEEDPDHYALDDLYQVNHPRWQSHFRSHWCYRMRYSSQPFQEQLALFFHNHAPTDIESLLNFIPSNVGLGNDGNAPVGIEQPCTSGSLPYEEDRNAREHRMAMQLMLDQGNLYRSEGCNNFENLLLSIVREPAMLIYLDNHLNVKGKPQENMAREMMELFSMGVGNYSETDVFEIAKCLTGETLPRFECAQDYDLSSDFSSELHETGTKTVFGQTISENMTGQETVDVVNLIVNQPMGLGAPYSHLPATAVYISWKILRWFVSHDVQLSPPDPIVLELADYMIGDDGGTYPDRRYSYDLKATFGKLFRSSFFYDSSNRYTMYKTPADFVIGSMRALDATLSASTMRKACDGMGMTLYEPPNVSGWHHGEHWLSSSALIERNNFADSMGDAIKSTWSLYEVNADWLDALPVTYTDHAGMITLIGDLLFHEVLTGEETSTLTAFLDGLPISDISSWTTGIKRRKIASLIHVMMTMPAYQLK